MVFKLKEIDWTTIAVVASFIILFIQRWDNHKDNKKTRQLQLNNIEHQQQVQWLNDFKRVAAEYIGAFKLNDLISAKNNLISNYEASYEITRMCIDTLIHTSAAFEFYESNDKELNRFFERLRLYYSEFETAAVDINFLATCRLNGKLDGEIINIIMADVDTPTNSKLKNHSSLVANKGEDIIAKIADARLRDVEGIPHKVRTRLKQIAEAEQTKINKILLD